MTTFENHDTCDGPAIVRVIGVVAVIYVSVLRYLKLIEVLFWKYTQYNLNSTDDRYELNKFYFLKYIL